MFKFAALLSVALLLAQGSILDDALESALSDPRELGKMFDQFERDQGRFGFSSSERTMRIKEFKKHLVGIHDHNKGHYSWKEGVNFFADMTDGERFSHLGLNVSNVERIQKRGSPGPLNVPDRVSWISQEAVTEIKDQGSCGSCWAFGALGTVEGVYKQTSGVLRHFSEQQILDCSYPSRDGCQGGWMRDGVNGINEQSNGQLASTEQYPYEGRDTTCRSRGNSMVGARVSSYVEVAEGEQYTISALAERVLTVTFCVLDSFFAYTGGIYRDETRTDFPNHALAAVAYTPSYILVKNSWGQSWGDRGFIKIARNYDGCSFHTYVGYAVLEPSGTEDTNPSDPVTDYHPGDDDDDDGDDGDDGDGGDCVDYFSGCRPQFCKYSLVRALCDRTCTDCDDGDDGSDECPSGTIRCDDGVCRHEHMC